MMQRQAANSDEPSPQQINIGGWPYSPPSEHCHLIDVVDTVDDDDDDDDEDGDGDEDDHGLDEHDESQQIVDQALSLSPPRRSRHHHHINLDHGHHRLTGQIDDGRFGQLGRCESFSGYKTNSKRRGYQQEDDTFASDQDDDEDDDDYDAEDRDSNNNINNVDINNNSTSRNPACELVTAIQSHLQSVVAKVAAKTNNHQYHHHHHHQQQQQQQQQLLPLDLKIPTSIATTATLWNSSSANSNHRDLIVEDYNTSNQDDEYELMDDHEIEVGANESTNAMQNNSADILLQQQQQQQQQRPKTTPKSTTSSKSSKHSQHSRAASSRSANASTSSSSSTSLHHHTTTTTTTTTTASGKQRRSYKCRHCPFETENKVENWKHIRIHMRPEKMLSCESCLFVTEYKHHLEYHQRNHSGYKPFRCDHCDYQCVNKSMLNSHMKSHSSIYQYQCGDCKYATKYVHSLKMHLRKYNHQPAQLMIDIYGRKRGPKSTTSNGSSPSTATDGNGKKSCSSKQNSQQQQQQQQQCILDLRVDSKIVN